MFVTHIVPALLDGVHQAVKVGAERLQACGIQEEAALAGGMRRGARRRAALLREGNLLVLAEELDFALREAQLVVGDGGGHHKLSVHTMLVPSQGNTMHGTRCKTSSAPTARWNWDTGCTAEHRRSERHGPAKPVAAQLAATPGGPDC